jgi:Ca2+-binding RTX toxin-like protein
MLDNRWLFDSAETIQGGNGNDVIRVERSLTFDWIPSGGNSYSKTVPDWDGYQWIRRLEVSPSTAQGSITFQNVSSGVPFEARPAEFQFVASNGQVSDNDPLKRGSQTDWSWDPQAGILDPHGGDLTESGGYGLGSIYDTNFVMIWSNFHFWHYSTTDCGHWELRPAGHGAVVQASAGDDVIYGGHGGDLIFGDAGHDVIQGGYGLALVSGGTGDDIVRGGTGSQTLKGDVGHDVLVAGTGSQVVEGGAGDDMLQGGQGDQVLAGGPGHDVLVGGSGPQTLDGGSGNDMLHIGAGGELLIGGTGHDIFAFDGEDNRAVITDFTLGQDLIQLARNMSGHSLATPDVILSALSTDMQGNAVIDFGDGDIITVLGLSVQDIATVPERVFVIA